MVDIQPKKITALPQLNLPLTGSELLLTVYPGNAQQGQSYGLTTSSLFKTIGALPNYPFTIDPLTIRVAAFDEQSGLPYNLTLDQLGIINGQVPAGGTTGQVLTKLSNADYDSGWSNAGSSSANTSLSNLSAVAINTSLLPGVNDGAALGSGSFSFSDLFLASGGVINWNNGSYTITQSGSNLSFSGIVSIPTNGSVVGNTAEFGTNLILSASTHVTSERAGLLIGDWLFAQDSAGNGGKDFCLYNTSLAANAFFVNPSNNDVSFDNSVLPLQTDQGALGSASFRWTGLFLSSTAPIDWGNGDITITGGTNVLTFAGASTNGWQFQDGPIRPVSNDGISLGTATSSFSDLFLASGGILNWNNGNYTVTHSANNLTFSGDTNFSSGTATLGNLSGVINAGAATSFEIPNSANPTVSVDGQIALDTTITDFSGGALVYYSGATYGSVAMPIAQFTSPQAGYMPTYNSVSDTFSMAAPLIINVKTQFNARGDSNGTTGSGTDDTAAIQAALNYAQALGAVVYFPSGCYRITNTITGSTNNGFYYLFGDGYGSKIYLDSASNISAFDFSPASLGATYLLPLVRVNGLNLITPRTASSASNRGFNITNNQRATIENCFIHDYYIAIVPTTSYGIRILRNNLTGIKGPAIYSGPSDSSFNVGQICNNSIYSCGLTTSDAAISIGSSNGGLLISDNNIESCAGAFITNSGATLTGVTFARNYMENQTSFDVYFAGSVSGWIIQGNRVGSGRTTTWENISNSQIIGNVFSGGGGTITIANTATNILYDDNIIEAGVTIVNNSIAGSAVARYSGPLQANYLQVIDGVTAPGTVSGVASIYIDSADGDLKIKFGDGTVKTIVVDT